MVLETALVTPTNGSGQRRHLSVVAYKVRLGDPRVLIAVFPSVLAKEGQRRTRWLPPVLVAATRPVWLGRRCPRGTSPRVGRLRLLRTYSLQNPLFALMPDSWRKMTRTANACNDRFVPHAGDIAPPSPSFHVVSTNILHLKPSSGKKNGRSLGHLTNSTSGPRSSVLQQVGHGALPAAGFRNSSGSLRMTDSVISNHRTWGTCHNAAIFARP